MHIVLRSERAKGKWSFLRHRKGIDALVKKVADRFQVRVYRHANVGNHLHLLVQVRKKEDFSNFLRVLTQSVVFLVAGARKGNPVGKFWSALAFSRIVDWGKDWKNALQYLAKNALEGKGVPRDRLNLWFRLKRELLRDLSAFES
jgi:REP element-mobilizing transposase RayT